MTGLIVPPAATVGSPLVVKGEAPQPSEAIQARLREIDRYLALRFYPFNKQFGIILHWHPNDPRWELVRKSEYPESGAFDLLGFVPPETSVEDAMQYVFTIAKRPGESKSWKQLCAEVMEHNERQSHLNAMAVHGEALNQAETVVANRARPTLFMNDTEAKTTRPSRWKE